MNQNFSRRQCLQTLAAPSLLSAQHWALSATNPLNRVDAGKGAPTLVFIHGFSGDLSDWDPQVRAFSSMHRCIAVDLPGHGKTPRSAPPTIEAVAGAVIGALKTDGVGKAVLIGHSMGCRVQSEIYRQAPELVSGQVYVDGSIIQGDPAAIAKGLQNRIASEGFMKMVDGVFEGLFVDSSPKAVRDHVYARRDRIDPDWHSRLFVDTLVWDASRSVEVLRNTKVPVLAIQSTALDSNLKRVAITPGMETPWMKVVRENVKGAQIALVEHVGHMTMLEAPTKTNELINSLLAKI